MSEQKQSRAVTLGTKLVLAQAPLALALMLLGVFSGFATRELGVAATRIFADNYRSVLAAQRMKEALERIDSLALVTIAGHGEDARAQADRHRQVFEAELAVERDNITEPGEEAIAARLAESWRAYREALGAFEALTARQERESVYFARLAPSFANVKRAADDILALNQDAMVRKGNRAERQAGVYQTLVIVVVVALSALGLFASIALTRRLLRPLGVVSQAVRRFGEGDLKARARVTVKDEIGQLAAEWNDMAETVERYRASSLGELLQAQHASQAAIDALPDPVVLTDSAGRLTGHNRAAATTLAIDVERGPAGDAFAGVDPGIRAALDRFRAQVSSGRGAHVPKGFEEAIRVTASDGERVILPRAAPIYGEAADVVGVATVFQDVTRLFRADELKNNLVATVAHEFRTPLTSLRMAIHLCVEGTVGPLTEKQADLLYAARDDCERLQGIVDDLLNLSRIESGRIDLHRRRTSPASLVNLAIDVHRLAAEDRHVTIRPEIFPGLPEVFADADRLQLVFTNLLSNAIRYSPERGEITVRAAPEPSGDVRFEVTDQGPGIPEEHRAALFEKFSRVPGSPEGGSGLGLFIAKGLVQAHSGRIGMHGAPDGGSTFWFVVPAAPDVTPALTPVER